MLSRLTTIVIVLMAFSASASVQPVTKNDLMERYISELEDKVNTQYIDVFNADEVLLAVNSYQSYLLLCSSGVAKNKCDEARQDHPKLVEVLNAHFEFHKDLAAMKQAASELEIMQKLEH